ncbi:MAG: hypothetical protein HQM08_27020 [Candidatus Riflebacteria bacterium]|nr:hypothetical protein [Candidatus Riflebacteria bacterium]
MTKKLFDVSMVVLGIALSIAGVIGCGSTNSGETWSNETQTSYNIQGSVSLSKIEGGNVASIRKSLVSNPSLDGFSASLLDSSGTVIKTVTIASNAFSFSGVSPLSNLKVVVSHPDASKRKFRLIKCLDQISSDLTLAVNEETTVIGLLIEASKNSGKILSVATVGNATFSAKILELVTVFVNAISSTISAGSSAENNTALTGKISEVVSIINQTTGTNTGTGTGNTTNTNTNVTIATNTASATSTGTGTGTGTGTATTTKTLSGVTIATTSIALNINGTYNLAGIVVTAKYSDSTTSVVAGTWSGTGVSGTTYTAPGTVGTGTVILTYTENGITKTANLTVSIISAKALSSITLSPASFTVLTNGSYNLSGITITANYTDSTTGAATGTWSGTGVSGTTYTAPSSGGIATLTCTYSEGGVTKTCDVSVTIKALSSITLASSSISVITNGSFNLSGISVTANYSNSTTATVIGAWSGTGIIGTTYTAPGISGVATVTCTYSEGGVTKTADVAVTIKALSSISVSPTSINVITNGTYNLAGITVTANYSNFTSAPVTGTWFGAGVNGTIYTAPGSIGVATITCTFCEGGTCQAASVSVSIRALSSISLATSSIKLLTNATYDLSKIGVTANYSNSTTAAVTGAWSGTGVNGNNYTAPGTTGVATLTCTYSEGGTTQIASLSISIKALTGISLSTDTLNLAANANYSLALITVTANYSDSTSATVTGSWSGTGVNGTTYTAPATSGVATITCTFTDGGITQIAKVTVNTTVYYATVSFGGRTVTIPNFALSKIWVVGMTGSYAGGTATLVGGTSTNQTYVVNTDGTTKSLIPQGAPDITSKTFTSITFNPPLPSGVTVQVKSTDTGPTTTIDQTTL